MAFHWLADDGPLMVVFGFSLPSSTQKERIVKVGIPLTKISGSAHAFTLKQISLMDIILKLFIFSVKRSNS